MHIATTLAASHKVLEQEKKEEKKNSDIKGLERRAMEREAHPRIHQA
jgi:hypothetical protein